MARHRQHRCQHPFIMDAAAPELLVDHRLALVPALVADAFVRAHACSIRPSRSLPRRPGAPTGPVIGDRNSAVAGLGWVMTTRRTTVMGLRASAALASMLRVDRLANSASPATE